MKRIKMIPRSPARSCSLPEPPIPRLPATTISRWSSSNDMTTIWFTSCLQWSYPNDLRVPGREMSHRAYDWLVEAEFLSAEPFWKNEKDIRGGTKSAEYVRYRMNEAGTKALGRLNGAGNADLCFASGKVPGVNAHDRWRHSDHCKCRDQTAAHTLNGELGEACYSSFTRCYGRQHDNAYRPTLDPGSGDSL